MTKLRLAGFKVTHPRGGVVQAAFDGFVHEGGFSQSAEDMANSVDLAFAPVQFTSQLLVVGRQLDQVPAILLSA